MKSGKWMSKRHSLIGFIKEELYMMQQESFVNPKCANKICKLQRSIYGLVQASRSWNIRFDEMIKDFAFIQKFMRNLYFQRSEWEHYRISDEYMLLTYC